MEQIKVAVFGEALIDMISATNSDFSALVGGSPFNVCRAFSRQNIVCSYMSPISSDNLGKQIEDMAFQEGIIAPFAGKSDKPTSIAIVTKNAVGLPDYTLYRDEVADLDITFEEMTSRIPQDISLFHTGSLVLVPKMQDFLLRLFVVLKNKNIPISIDINMRKLTTVNNEQYHSTVLELMKYATYLKVSDEDLEILGTKERQESYCHSLVTHSNIKLIALTKGEQGASLIGQNCQVDGQVSKPDKFVDTVGAGDTFFASLLTHILQNELQSKELNIDSFKAFENALNYAQIAASINISRKGCQPPTYSEIQKLFS